MTNESRCPETIASDVETQGHSSEDELLEMGKVALTSWKTDSNGASFQPHPEDEILEIGGKVDISSWKTDSNWASFQPHPEEPLQSVELHLAAAPPPAQTAAAAAPLPQDASSPPQVALMPIMVAATPVAFFPMGAPTSPWDGTPMYVAENATDSTEQQNPSSKSKSKVDAQAKGNTDNTTVMFRNIPNNYSREMLIELLDAQGFQGSYDFFYWPMDFHKNAGLGYAFINFVSEAEASRFQGHFHGFTDWTLASHKIGECSWSQPLQGLAPHIERYRNSPVMHQDVPDSHKPLLFSEGVRIPFPAPTRQIRVPRKKR